MLGKNEIAAVDEMFNENIEPVEKYAVGVYVVYRVAVQIEYI